MGETVPLLREEEALPRSSPTCPPLSGGGGHRGQEGTGRSWIGVAGVGGFSPGVAGVVWVGGGVGKATS